MRRVAPAKPIESERELDHHLFNRANGVAAALGWDTYHTLRSKGSRAGYPDRTCWRERLLFIETKGPKTPVSPEQVRVMTGLAKAGAEVYLARPADVPELDRVLGYRWMFWRDLFVGSVPGLHCDGVAPWTPRCLWLPSGIRADES